MAVSRLDIYWTFIKNCKIKIFYSHVCSIFFWHKNMIGLEMDPVGLLRVLPSFIILVSFNYFAYFTFLCIQMSLDRHFLEL